VCSYVPVKEMNVTNVYRNKFHFHIHLSQYYYLSTENLYQTLDEVFNLISGYLEVDYF